MYFSVFDLLIDNETIILKKRFDFKIIEIKKNNSLIELSEQPEIMTLKLENYEILRANKMNIIQKMTIIELARKLKSVENNK